ncbi:MAG: glutamate--tRNA ligase [Minisyncoccota bacterium]
MSHATFPIRARFAPSPTGLLHVGGLRTALYNYLFVKKNDGDFLLRIEDTDQQRFVQGAIEALITSLDTAGITANEGVYLEHGVVGQRGTSGPYIQSKRLDIYKKHVDMLIENRNAYYCFCSHKRLIKLREDQANNKQAPKYDKHCLSLKKDECMKKINDGEAYVIRLNVLAERGDVIFEDIIRGLVTINVRDIDDQVLLKSDGFPTYHLANVVDDHLMHITHVIRAEEWLPSTPKHILLYEAFGWEIPVYAHLPLLLNADKSKLSKRQGDVAVEEYLAKGYLQEALVNFVALLGWNPGAGSTQEIFTMDELVEKFDLTQVHKAGAIFDLKKLDWMNAEYIKRMTINELYERACVFLEAKDFFLAWQKRHSMLGEEAQTAFMKRVLTVEQDRLAKLSDVGENNPFFFSDDITYNVALLHWKQNTTDMTKEALAKAESTLANVNDTDWETRRTLETILMATAGERRGDFLWPLRVALTGAERSPSPFDVAWVLGKSESLKRIRSAIAFLT